jgi:hypothetical protein
MSFQFGNVTSYLPMFTFWCDNFIEILQRGMDDVVKNESASGTIFFVNEYYTNDSIYVGEKAKFVHA